MLRPALIEPPASLPVTIDEAKLHLRIDPAPADAVLTALIGAATKHLDGWTGTLGRCIVNQSWRQDFGYWPQSRDLRLPFPNCSSIVVKYFDATNTEQTVPDTAYEVLEDALGGFVRLGSSFDRPVLYGQRSDAVRVAFISGFGDASAVPDAIKMAIVFMVGDFYARSSSSSSNVKRETVEGVSTTEFQDADKLVGENPLASLLLDPYRRFGI
ncbi:phage head-tail connector protein [Mesorhizobium sp. AD1-1]|uniref:head-tail connector protein n=1 Tax=Mesorhizobium sp. AD1-1 TaxID=2876621 RepID=UPI001CCB19D2|nr:phage head-tail connector protein [Mesorhizobium sp. AD1-1]MBZ9719104.1 phage head-tail connector protein [Mesorhizobium sp. AD1-1]